MKKLTIKQIIILLVIAVIMVMPIKVSALGFDELLGDPTQDLEVTPNPPEDETPTTPTTPTESESQETLPQTGDASDYAIFLLIGLFIVISIYAYKKVRDYNRI